MPTTGNRGLRFKYSSGIAPLVTSKEYTDLINNYKKMGASAFPHILKLGGMAVDTTQNRNKWRIPLKDLYECAAQLNGAPLMKDHDIDHVNSIIGKVRSAWVEEDGAGGGKIMWEGETIDQDLIPKILLGYVKNNSIQIAIPEAYCDNCITHLGKQEADAALDSLDFPCPRCGSLEMIARHPMVLEQSMVAIPAYEKAEVSPIGFKAALNDFNEKRIENAKKAGWDMKPKAKTKLPDITPLVVKAFNVVAQVEVAALEMQAKALRASLAPMSEEEMRMVEESNESRINTLMRKPMNQLTNEEKQFLDEHLGETHYSEQNTGGELSDFPLAERPNLAEEGSGESGQCSECGGPLTELGSLGSRKHYRCRNCGMDSSSDPTGKTEGGEGENYWDDNDPQVSMGVNTSHCDSCGGELQELDSLGSRKHYRCRNCGMDSSSEGSQDNESDLGGGMGSRLP